MLDLFLALLFGISVCVRIHENRKKFLGEPVGIAFRLLKYVCLAITFALLLALAYLAKNHGK